MLKEPTHYDANEQYVFEDMQVMNDFGLKWTWANMNTEETYCPITGLRQHPYKGGGKLAPLGSKIGCSMSHFMLWKKCVELDEPILILEHDSVFLRPFPDDIEFKGICQINDPNGSTRKGAFWSRKMQQRGGVGVFPKTGILGPEKKKYPMA